MIFPYALVFVLVFWIIVSAVVFVIEWRAGFYFERTQELVWFSVWEGALIIILGGVIQWIYSIGLDK